MFGLRDERTPEAKRNHRIVIPIQLALLAVGIVGLLLHSTIIAVIGLFGVLTAGLLYRWV